MGDVGNFSGLDQSSPVVSSCELRLPSPIGVRGSRVIVVCIGPVELRCNRRCASATVVADDGDACSLLGHGWRDVGSKFCVCETSRGPVGSRCVLGVQVRSVVPVAQVESRVRVPREASFEPEGTGMVDVGADALCGGSGQRLRRGALASLVVVRVDVSETDIGRALEDVQLGDCVPVDVV